MLDRETAIRRAKNNFSFLQVDFEINSLVDFLITQDIENVIEIGTDKGGSFYLWCQLFKGIKISVDLPHANFGTDDFDVAEMNNKIQSEYSEAHFIHGDSTDDYIVNQVEKLLEGRKVDLLFIDGDHTYEGVKNDFDLYRKFVKDDKFIMFHDIVDSQFHRERDCYVSRFWNSLQGEKIEFTGGRDWAGIGLIKNNHSLKMLL